MNNQLDADRKMKIVNALRWLAKEPPLPEPGSPADLHARLPPVQPPRKLPRMGTAARLFLDLSDEVWEPGLSNVTVSRCLRELDSTQIELVSNLMVALVKGPEHIDKWLVSLPIIR